MFPFTETGTVIYYLTDSWKMQCATSPGEKAMKKKLTVLLLALVLLYSFCFLNVIASAGQTSELPALTVNGKTEDQTLGINESYTWTVTLPNTTGETSIPIRVNSNNSWMYFTTKGRAFSFNDMAPQTPGIYSVYVQYVMNGVSAFSPTAVWSDPSNVITLTVEKRGEVVPGAVNVSQQNAIVARGENLFFSFTEGQHVMEYMAFIRTENDSIIGERLFFEGPQTRVEYPTAGLEPGNYKVCVWFRGEAGYSEPSGYAVAFASFTVSEPSDEGLLFCVNKTEGMVGEEIVFSAYHPDANRFEMTYRNENNEEETVGSLMAKNGAVIGKIELNPEMSCLRAEAFAADGASLESKTIPLTVISFGMPTIFIDAPGEISEGKDLDFDVIFCYVENCHNPSINVNIRANDSLLSLEFEQTSIVDDQGNTLIHCTIPSNQIPLSGVSVFARYDPQVKGWEPADASKSVYYVIPKPVISLSAAEIPIGTDVTLTIEETEEVSYYAVMPYAISPDHQETALLKDEQYLLDSENNTILLSGTCFLDAGTYRIDVRAIPKSAQKKGSSASVFLTVKEENASTTVLSVQGGSTFYTDSEIMFDTGEAFENIFVRTWRSTDMTVYDRHDFRWSTTGDQHTFYLSFPDEGTYSVRASSRTGERWQSLSDPVTIHIIAKGVLNEPNLQVDQDTLMPGKDITIYYDLDSRTEEVELLFYKKLNEQSFFCVSENRLSPLETEYKIDGSSLTTGEYKVSIRCSAYGFESCSSDAIFSISGSRGNGPLISVGTSDTYVNRPVQFSAQMQGATALRISYSFAQEQDDYSYDQEVHSQNGLFTWEYQCEDFDLNKDTVYWYIRAMALVNGIWTDWGGPAAITIRCAGILGTPYFTSVPSKLREGEALHVSVSEVSNAREYRFSLFCMKSGPNDPEQVRTWTFSTNEATLIEENEEVHLSEGLYMLKCSVYAEDYISLSSATADIQILSYLEGNTLVLPTGMESVEEYAFYGSAAETAIIQGNCHTVGAYAFANMTRLTEVHIPDSIIYIDDTAFDGCGELTVRTNSEYAADYALSHGMTVKPLE